jgi:hypothetical protein
MHQQLLGVSGAGEPADGVAGQAQFGRDRAGAVSLGQHPVHRCVALPRPLGHPAAPPHSVRRGGRRAGGIGTVLLAGRGCGGRGQAAAVPGDRPLGGLAEVVPQVPAIGDLDR